MFVDREIQTLATMSPNFNELVSAFVEKHLEAPSLKASTSAYVDSGASKSSAIPPRTSRKDGEFYNNVGHVYFTPTQMAPYNNLGNPPMYDGTHFSFWKSSRGGLRGPNETRWHGPQARSHHPGSFETRRSDVVHLRPKIFILT
jgi:hypothetical protein